MPSIDLFDKGQIFHRWTFPPEIETDRIDQIEIFSIESTPHKRESYTFWWTDKQINFLRSTFVSPNSRRC